MLSEETILLNGMQIYHNYIRDHQGLKDKNTPAEKCGIDIEGENQWLFLYRTQVIATKILYKINLFRWTNNFKFILNR
jgi:hypothetical protein